MNESIKCFYLSFSKEKLIYYLLLNLQLKRKKDLISLYPKI